MLLSETFCLRGWQSNYSKLETSYDPNITSTETEKHNEVISVLGLMCDLHRDVSSIKPTMNDQVNFRLQKEGNITCFTATFWYSGNYLCIYIAAEDVASRMR